MPLLAFGANVWDAATCANATSAALQAGFRFVWSSQLIGDECQAAQGKAIKASAIRRDQLFISGTANTASCTSLDDCYQKTKAAAESQLQLLSDPLDMLMLDYPPYTQGCDNIIGQWKAFEEVYASKRVRTIAVSNFLTDQSNAAETRMRRPLSLHSAASTGMSAPRTRQSAASQPTRARPSRRSTSLTFRLEKIRTSSRSTPHLASWCRLTHRWAVAASWARLSSSQSARTTTSLLRKSPSAGFFSTMQRSTPRAQMQPTYRRMRTSTTLY